MTMSHVLMVRPTGFAFNPETAATNAFMAPGDPGAAVAEFDAFVADLRAAGVEVIVLEGPPDAPDAVFPNNWISFHGALAIVYPMAVPSRRRERSLLPQLALTRVKDLTPWEDEGKYLEGTGSLVLDRANRIAYASLSPRTTPAAVRDWCAEMDYWPVLFEAHESNGSPIYHTNVVLSLGGDWAVFCPDVCPEPNRVLAELRMTGKRVVLITADQMRNFCGNVLELGDLFVASRRAWSAFTPDQRETLASGKRLLTPDIATIETIGGGSVRCMIAEIAER